MDQVKLSTGRAFYAHEGIIGLSPDGWVYEGYDGVVLNPERYVNEAEGFPADLTDAECCELADMMILRWTEFKRNHSSQKDLPART